jgi:hypothetical protein
MAQLQGNKSQNRGNDKTKRRTDPIRNSYHTPNSASITAHQNFQLKILGLKIERAHKPAIRFNKSKKTELCNSYRCYKLALFSVKC